MEAFIDQYGALLIKATWETIYMTVVSTFFSYLLGVPLGVALSVTKKGGKKCSFCYTYGFYSAFYKTDCRHIYWT